MSEKQNLTDNQRAAEQHFIETHRRNSEGRFVVQLPFKEDPRVLGDSRPLAVRQFLALERKFEKNPSFHALYSQVINDQLEREWIEPVGREYSDGPVYYMPHHGVVKESSATTKLRIVYNASAKSSTGVSLNDILRVGPTVQPDLCSILLRFRQYPYAMTADISKMYLQLVLDPTHSDFHRFVWRANKSEPIRDFRFTRVCFGVASSPFLATRALIQLAQECENSHPLAAEALRHCFYVDDCIMSTESVAKAKDIQSQLLHVLKSELVVKVQDQFTLESIHFWCDSMVVLHWINGDPEDYKIFVGRRLKEIRKVSAPFQWRHVRTHSNPADLISRGTSPLQIQESSLWWHGPEWLLQPESQWPQPFHSPHNSQQLQRHGRTITSSFRHLNSLAPFVDYSGFIRVGGRLENSNMPFPSKHPIILPKSQLTHLIVKREHLKQLHAGPLVLLSTIRQQFWPVSGRNMVMKVCHECPRCTKANPKPLKQLMADLPTSRVCLWEASGNIALE
uniref:Uncharacterized protein n=1 Tax=Phlebotomus papatasi TaxID=29031 RepID=A0A1B0D818_PHLPP